jgi:hypothetical protein
MRFFVFAILLMPNILFAQSNELYKLLKWDNTKQQQQLIAWYDIQDNSTIELSISNSIKTSILYLSPKLTRKFMHFILTQKFKLSQPARDVERNLKPLK